MVKCLDQWDAWYNRMPGAEDPNLYVSGKVGCESSSIELSLEPDNEGPFDDPALFVLRLRASSPPVGDDQYVEKDVDWSDDVGPDIKRVQIRGECEAEIPVRIID